MKRTITSTLVLATLGACGGPATTTIPTPSPVGPTPDVAQVVAEETREELVAFGSESELKDYLKRIATAQQARYGKGVSLGGSLESGFTSAVDMAPTASADAAGVPMGNVAGEAGAEAGEEITNNQEAGVDEGGIVKANGDYLVVLRRGRLFTVKLGDKDLRPVSTVDVRPAKGHDAWYDEMLIHDDTIVVIGYSYMAGATEIGVFQMDAKGRLQHEDTHFLRSNDYYSSRNYASRLLGDKLVFYMPYWLSWTPDRLPELAHWTGKEQYDDWDQIVKADRIFRPIQPTEDPVLHTVVTCDLSKKKFDCSAQGIVGPAGRSFYVSQDAVYVWVHQGFTGQAIVADDAVAIAEDGQQTSEEGEGAGQPAPIAKDPEPKAPPAPAAVYRLPLDGGDPGALRVWGAPVDQFSFKQGSDGYLNVLVRAESQGDFMWGAEMSAWAQNDTALLRVPVKSFSGGVATAKADAYTDLPEPGTGDPWAFQNRFVGDHLIYGTGFGWHGPKALHQHAALVHRYRGGPSETTRVRLQHAVDRIEVLGNDAVIVGSNGEDLHFTSLDLQGRPAFAGSYVQEGANQGETRSHGFFFKPSGDESGTLGLPIRKGSAPGYSHLVQGSAEILFLDVKHLRFRPLGTLASDPEAGQSDQCEVSCVDWYGNARPIFYRGRVFALLGYELVEGSLRGTGIREVDRTNMLSLLQKKVAR